MSSPFESVEQQASYGIGRQLGDQLANAPFSGFDREAALAGFSDAIAARDLQVSADQINGAFREIQGRLKAEEADKARQFAGAGEAYLAENAKREGVTVTASGLQYEIITEGSGARPGRNDTVRTHYHGTLIDGTVFDSSVQRGEPAEFPVGGVIAGWTEALQLMPVGSKWRLHIPYQLAYGERGAGGAIGPYSALVFEVELLDIL
ncbi:MAG: FKBP-type peptidyl-prolyl cis-trans isomerase [Porticoccaceae bacterium]|nr:FKBP-type peptidyl-prolyl cis-trans isomerase [Pseudomonadota bacterium]